MSNLNLLSGQGETSRLLPRSLDQRTYNTRDRGLERPNFSRSGSFDTRTLLYNTGNKFNVDQDNHPNTIENNLTHTKSSYISYYLPILSWLPQYSWSKLFGDICAGVSLASFQIPLQMSYASSLAKLSPITGLYGLMIPPFIYALFGTVPQMVVGPEAALCVIIGQTTDKINHTLNPEFSANEVTAIITVTLGSILLIGGLFRFGFIDNLLSRALLRGFISAFGVVMIIDELTTELGLDQIPINNENTTSTIGKIKFIYNNIDQINKISSILSLFTFIFLIFFKILKKFLPKRNLKFKWILFIPEILIAVLVTTILSNLLKLNENENIEIVGDINFTGFHIQKPITMVNFKLIRKYFSTSFILCLLGFFESSTTSKSLSSVYNYTISPNRELVALGMVNVTASLFGALPSFGGYGRSRINALSQAKTPLSAVIMAIITMISVKWLLSYFYYLPICILATIVSVIGVALIEEVPADIRFYWKISGYDELLTLFTTFVLTIVWSAEAGLASGITLAFVRVLKHSSRSRIQILRRIPNTNIFRNADELIEEAFTVNSFNNFQGNSTIDLPNIAIHDNHQEDSLSIFHDPEIEEIEGCLIVKIPEPLTFVNTGDLRSRLNRLEKYGSMLVHPSQPARENARMIKYLIIDLKGMASIDTSSVQILYEVIKSYRERDIQVYFTRVPTSQHIRDVFIKSGIVDLIQSQRKNLPSSSLNSNEHPQNINNLSRISSLKSIKSHILNGLGDGFYASIEDALVAADEEERIQSIISNVNINNL